MSKSIKSAIALALIVSINLIPINMFVQEQKIVSRLLKKLGYRAYSGCQCLQDFTAEYKETAQDILAEKSLSYILKGVKVKLKGIKSKDTKINTLVNLTTDMTRERVLTELYNEI